MFECLSDSIAAHSSDKITKEIFNIFLTHELFFQHFYRDDRFTPLALINLTKASFCDASCDFDFIEVNFEDRLDRLFFFEFRLKLGYNC